ncbi:MAG: ABC transporter permease [Christensenella sp.]
MNVNSRAKWKDNFIGFSKAYPILYVLIGLVIIAAFASDVFLTSGNLLNILRQISVIGILSCGMTFVVLTGNIDLSVGATVSFTACITLTLLPYYGIGLSILIAVAVGALIGAINGLIISYTGGRMGESFIITFGMQTAVGAIAFIYTQGFNVSVEAGSAYSFIGQGSIGMVPVSVIIFIVVAVLCWFVLNKTVYGRKVYSIGENEEATKLTGINTKLVRMSVYIVAGVLAALAAVVLSSRVMGSSPEAGKGYELDAIAAIVVGGTSLTGGQGGIGRTIIGVLLMGVLANLLNILNITAYPQMMVKGAIIIIAVLIDLMRKRNAR